MKSFESFGPPTPDSNDGLRLRALNKLGEELSTRVWTREQAYYSDNIQLLARDLASIFDNKEKAQLYKGNWKEKIKELVHQLPDEVFEKAEEHKKNKQS